MSDKISTEAENPALRKAVVTGSLPFVMFPDDNKIRFWQDFSGWVVHTHISHNHISKIKSPIANISL